MRVWTESLGMRSLRLNSNRPPLTQHRLRLLLRTMATEATTSAPTPVNRTAHPFTRGALEDLLSRRFFYAPAFEIYGGVAGLYDYGPPGSALHANILQEWRKHFIIEESMLELDTTIMTPAPVFETSGHVARFADWMVKDTKTGDVLRADHLVEGVLEARLKGDKEARGVAATAAEEAEVDPKKKKKKQVKTTAVKLDDAVVQEYETVLNQIDNYTGPQLGELVRKFNIVNPDTGNPVDEPVQFNLMFDSSIGPTGKIKGYLRPETAQGHFLNFQRLLAFNNGQIPFASAQIGRSFRNEISPRAGLLRVREFTMSEIEHYVDPLDKSHARFPEIKDIKLRFLPKDVQSDGRGDICEITVGEAVASKMVDNETLGYFLARIYLFLLKIGVEPSRLRFRQHMSNEMAHYASDCWDAEIETSYGWIECVGCADRSAYDLTVHSKATGKPLVARQNLPEPIVEEKETPEFNLKVWGKTFKGDGDRVKEIVNRLGEEGLLKLRDDLSKGPVEVADTNGDKFTITPEMVKIEKKTTKISVRDFTPNVIEPSFGIGRIMYSVLEHTYWARESDAARGVLSLPPMVAPTKCLIVPISNQEVFQPLIKDVSSKLRAAGVYARVDDSGASIGKRYARNDELGTPYGCTLDFASVQNGTMTLRERDTTDQLIGKVDEVVEVVKDLVFGQLDWEGACKKLTKYTGVQDV